LSGVGPPDPLRDLVARFDPEAFDAPPDGALLRLSVRGEHEADALVDEDGVRLEPAGTRAVEPDAALSAPRATWERMARDVSAGLEAYRRGELELRRNLHLGVGFLAATSGAEGPGRLRFHTVRCRGARFSVLEAGEGEPLVMLHGLGGTKVSMLPIVAALAPVGYRTISADLPGFGDSGKPLRAAYDPPFFSRSIAALLDGLELERANVLGHSLGGRVALEVGMRHPDRVTSLILLTPSLAWLRERPWAGFVRLLRPELGLLQPTPRAAVDAVLKRAIPGRGAPFVEAGIDEFLRSYLTARGRAAFYATLRNIYLEEPEGENGFWPRLRELQARAMFVWGRQDGVVPVAFAQHVREALPDATHHEFDCGHLPQLERPRETNAAIAEFLGAPRVQRVAS
jgi:pimeloyl-ACP methyl ester carboxylesterase